MDAKTIKLGIELNSLDEGIDAILELIDDEEQKVIELTKDLMKVGIELKTCKMYNKLLECKVRELEDKIKAITKGA